MLLTRRGMGATCAQMGPLPAGYLCQDSGGEGVLTQVGATPTVVNVSGSGANTLLSSGLTDQVQTCVGAGGTMEDCIAAVLSSNATGLPSWLLPVGLGLLGFLLVRAMTR